jgi:hypothetical protein
MRISSYKVAATAAAIALIATGCASGPDVRGDYDHNTDFGKYRTYGFVSSATTAGGAKSLAEQTLQAAAAREMEARGYKASATPDLAIAFRGQLQDKTDIQSTPAPYYGPGWGYRGWGGAPYGGTEVTTYHYKVGTIVMDVVDREARQVVYQGGLETKVSKEMLENRQAALETAVQQIFAKYPFVAGQSAPVVPAKK